MVKTIIVLPNIKGLAINDLVGDLENFGIPVAGPPDEKWFTLRTTVMYFLYPLFDVYY